jgi:CheY-like chemotaxis protein
MNISVYLFFYQKTEKAHYMINLDIKSILIVEDDKDLRELIKGELEDLLGVRIVEAEDGAIAYRKARN